ncbi:MAG: fumarylacetoacetate hydrolase family protein [Proteobacteria bacterium]|nr:fumarylacetoacetate hydrolase family protein [Pseudomonadota bacterium]MDA0994854.1 fumarylacetoacetate hydrolase family protein [Pseudomonadota bacterium]
MKLASLYFDGADRIGVLKNDNEIALIDDVGEMTDLIRLGSDAKKHISHALSDGIAIACNGIKWYPPVRRPGKICGIAMNNSASNARKISAPDHPAFFLKPSTCLVGHGEPVRVRRYYGSVHPEPELAVILGTTVRDVDAADAMDCVFGYSIFNDITGNGMRADDLFHYWALYPDEQNPDELVRREQHLSYAARYKGTDTFGSMGPFITTAEDISDPDQLDVSCRVGGEVIAEDSTRYYNYKVAELISYISQFLTLEPGDIISCGTAFKPSPGRKSIHHANFQRVAGPVEITISGLGTLSNPVEIEDKVIGQWRLR